MVIPTVTLSINYKINSEGNCSACDCRSAVDDEFCMPFDTKVKWYASSSYRQCKKCKEFLKNKE